MKSWASRILTTATSKNVTPHEPFFVKNLENVQGDERDVIFISVGYGRDSDGKLPMSFGPLNLVGGERRLNVLITRARRQCEVFSNIQAGDIDLSRTQAAGVRALKRFLGYAESRDLDIPELTGKGPDSPFEEDVAGVLKTLGYEYDAQVGSAGFFIDLAVKDRQHSGRYVLGIECDGASYHSARSARDRDRLRQEVLEGLGWRIHRIWSTDWFHNRDREIKHLTDAIRDAQSKTLSERAGHDPGTVAVNREQSSEQIQRFEMSRPRVSVRSEPYKMYCRRVRYSGPLHEVPPYSIALWVKSVVDVESPIHIEELIRRITHAASVVRSGSRIQKAVLDGVEQAERNGTVVRKGDFVWKSGSSQPRVRDRSKLPITSRKIELIAPEEITAAIKIVVGGSMGIFAEDVTSAACTRLGFGRAGALIVATVQEVLSRMLADGVLSTQNGYIVLAERV